LHRLSKNEEAIKKCLELPQNEIKTRLLLAQINYKLANYGNAADQYVSLLKDMKSEDANDLKTNLMACAANDSLLGQIVNQTIAGVAVDSFEFYFNQSQS
jgi:hypothetical protein